MSGCNSDRKLPAQRVLESWLRQQSVSWEIVNGRQHKHVILDGRLIGVLSYNNNQTAENVIRRARKYLAARA